MRKHSIVALLVAVIFLGLTMTALADGIIIPIPQPRRPAPPLRSLAIKYHRVTVSIEDQVATTRVDQVFINETGYDIEGEYIFPLPEGASISRFSMWVDGKRLEAEVLEKDQARKLYEDIVRQQRDPALLEYVGRNAFRARIYPIQARGEKRVELEYTEVLKQDNGLVRYVYPLNTEKFSTRPLEDVSVLVHIVSRQPVKAIYSPSHEIEVHREGELEADIGYEAMNVTPDRDFVLYYSLSENDLGINLVSYNEPGEEGFFLLLLAPKAEVKEQEIVAKDVLFVLDTSGSMRGEKLAQTKRAAKYVLDNLHDEDRFNIISFSTGTRQYSSGLRPVGEVAQAYAFINSLQAGGGTNIGRAFEEALAQTRDNRPQVILFLTDGLATEGEKRTGKILEKVDKLAGDNVRVFALGVGYDVHTTLLDTVSQSHHGTSVYVRPDEDIERGVSSFYEKISTPVLADISIDFGTVHVEDTFPYPLPDLFAGGQLVMVGRYRSAGNTTVVLRGLVNGEAVRYTFEDIRFRTKGGAEFIPRLWATRKIGHLLTQIRLHGSERELVDEIVELSVRYGIVTPYTSFLIDEGEDALSADGRRTISKRAARPMPMPTPLARGGGRGSSPGGEGFSPTASLRRPEASGKVAVEKSIAQEALRQADIAAAPETEQVRTVGNKAFVLRGETWTDTTYDAKKMEAELVPFGGSRYFELVRSHPEWGRYLALGTHLILVWEGQAYQFAPNQETGAGQSAEPTEIAKTDTPAAFPTQTRTPRPSGASKPTPTRSFWELVSDWLKDILP